MLIAAGAVQIGWVLSRMVPLSPRSQSYIGNDLVPFSLRGTIRRVEGSDLGIRADLLSLRVALTSGEPTNEWFGASWVNIDLHSRLALMHSPVHRALCVYSGRLLASDWIRGLSMEWSDERLGEDSIQDFAICASFCLLTGQESNA